jgi:predicted Rossmann fold flavoprotein
VDRSAGELPIVVIGGGAAGSMAAIFASGGRRVVLLESTRDGGRKILISGGGRCNVLPSSLTPTQYVTGSSPNTLKKILLSWPLSEQRRFFEEELDIPLALEPETGKLFPVSNRAREVRDRLLDEVRKRGGEIWFEARVSSLARAGDGAWIVGLSDGREIAASCVVLATGGLSVPQTGSDGAGLEMVRKLGHTINPTYPALTPLTAEPARHAPLAGISLEVQLSAPLNRGSFVTRGGFLFTHRGYSGPSVLDVSHLAVLSRMQGGARQLIEVQWAGLDAEAWERIFRESSGGTAGSVVRRRLPDRLAEALLAEADVDPTRPLPQLRREERARLVTVLTAYPLPWTGDEGYKKAEVTGGGVALSEIDPRTMQSRLNPGLLLCGEVLDAFGPIGGYNFAWAWATGRAAGLAARSGTWPYAS